MEDEAGCRIIDCAFGQVLYVNAICLNLFYVWKAMFDHRSGSFYYIVKLMSWISCAYSVLENHVMTVLVNAKFSGQITGPDQGV